ncbi:NADPH-adrenodoxin reductase [Cystobasidiomycetes sp. EMM_F5]
MSPTLQEEAKTPNGVTATTMYNAFDVAANIVDDFIVRTPQDAAQRPPLPDLCTQGFGDQRIVSWQDWQAIDAAERARGAKLGKEREKFVRVDDMLAVLG